MEGSHQITDTETAIITILQCVKKAGKHVLITIDEVTNNEYMQIFAASFQIFVRQDLPVFFWEPDYMKMQKNCRMRKISLFYTGHLKYH